MATSTGIKKVDRLGRPVKHGMYDTPEHQAWTHMTYRCRNHSAQKYNRYGGRGISVCCRWQGMDGFVNFFADMGRRPSPGHSLDRIDNNGNYCPENCRWATKEEQNCNRGDSVFLSYNGVRMTVSQWSREIGINVRTLSLRVEAGWADERALTTPVAKRRWRCSPGVPSTVNSPKYLGVGWNKRRRCWIAYIAIRRKRVHVGCFSEQIEAALARDKEAIRLLGSSAKLNFAVASLLKEKTEAE